MLGLTNPNLGNKKGSLAGLPSLPNKPEAFLDGLLLLSGWIIHRLSQIVNRTVSTRQFLLSEIYDE